MALYTETSTNRPTRAIISMPNLRNNLSIVRSLIKPDVRIMGVVKANAYGHGIVEIATEMLSNGASYLGVAYIEEAVCLRRNGITAPILVLGAVNVDQIEDFIANDIDINSSSIDKSRAISEVAQRMNKKAKVHLKIDTGMERIGVHWYNAAKLIDETFSLKGIEVVGIFSHFAKADTDFDFTRQQIARFEEVLEYMRGKKILPKLIHIANSEGVISFPEAHYTMVRPGIILYGYATKKEINGKILKPVMSLFSKVAYFKVVPENTGISYNHTHTTKKQTRVVTLPIGYGDGYNRLLSNRGEVIIRGKKYPVVGNVCMDQVMVDIGDDGVAYNGDDVLLFGESGADEVSLEILCDRIETITYEMLCMISSRVPRIYVR